MSRNHRPAYIQLAVILFLFAGFASALGNDIPADLIAQADIAYASRHIEESMIEAIDLLEAVLPNLDTLPIQSQSDVLNRLSQLCYELPTFSAGGDTPEDGLLYEKGKAYGLQSLRLDPGFVEAEGDSFVDAVAVSVDAAALHWTASNWGKISGMNPLQGLLHQSKILALFSRAVEVNPEYWGASASASLGSLLIMSPSAMGGDKEAGLALVESAIELAPDYLSNHLILAEYWGFTYGYFGELTGIRDAELVEREVAYVLESETDTWPFWNPHARRQALFLLAQLYDMQD